MTIMYLKTLKEYIILFFKVLISSKISFVWYLILPLLLFFFSHYKWLWSDFSIQDFYLQTSIFISYIIFVLSINASISLIRMRETGALKVFKFISGSKYLIIWAQILTQIMSMILSCSLFAIIVGAVFLHQILGTLTLLSIILFVCIFTAIPLSIFFLWLLLLPIKQESLVTILNIVILCFFLISANSPLSAGKLQALLLVNPMEVVRQMTFEITNLIMHTSLATYPFSVTGIILFIYLLIGLCSIRLIKVSSITQRT